MFNKLVIFLVLLSIVLLLGNHAFAQQVMLQLVPGSSTNQWSNGDYILVFEINGKKVEIDRYKILNNTAQQTNTDNAHRIINEDINGDGIDDYLIYLQISRSPELLHVVDGKSFTTIYSHGWNKKFKELNLNMGINYKYKMREIILEVIYSDAPEEGKYDEYLKWKNAHQTKYLWSDSKRKFVKVFYKNYSTIRFNKALRDRIQRPR